MVDFRKAFVTGWPISHSRSPLIHNYWIKQLRLEGEYLKQPIEPEHLEDFLKDLSQGSFVGGNITIPHKETAFNIAEKLDETARRLGAVNTVWLENDVLHASNTDGYGFLANLDSRSSGWDNKEARKRGALVLGAGGAARAVVDGINQRGFDKIIIANRTIERAERLRDDLAPHAEVISYSALEDHHRDVAFVVNTTSVGMDDGSAPISLEGFRTDTVVNDIIYTPLETPLLLDAKQRGMKPIDGLGMLLHQAVPGFEKWFGQRPVVTEELRNLVLADLGYNT